MTTAEHHHATALDLDRALLGRLSSDAQARFEHHREACARCARAMAEREEAAATFVRDVFPRKLTSVQQRLSSPRSLLRRTVLFFIPVAGLVSALVVVLHGSDVRKAPEEDDVLRVKGGALRIFAHRDGRVFRIPDGSHLLPGDAVRFVLQSPGLPYAMIASVDGDGRGNVYHPYRGTVSTSIDPARPFEAPDTIVLDTAPGPERIFALFSERPLDAASVMGQLNALGKQGYATIRTTTKLQIPGVAQVSFLIEKDAKP